MQTPERRVLLAAPRGFCAGVDRAVATVEKTLAANGSPVYVRREIVHNKYVVEDLKRRGVIFVDELDKIPEGATVVFSAHGVSPAVRTEAEARGLRAIDATCPLVMKVHQEVVRFAADGYRILLIGHEGHDEVEGTMGEAPDRVSLVDTAQDVENLGIGDEDRVIWLSQTTLSVEETAQRVAQVSERFPALEHLPSSDICYATTNRQAAVKQLAPECELVIVVGSPNSSNSQRLVEVAIQAGADAAHLVDTVDEIELDWLTGVRTVGVTSGASVPELLVQQVLRFLADQGWPEPEEVVTAEERQVFALPRALRD